MFAEIIYICNKCGNTFSVVNMTKSQIGTMPTSSQFNQKQIHSCPQCSSTETEKLETNLINRKK